ncbi:MAG: T9SS type A sorting domain-containing protein [Chitinophagales bacterium]|nr:T9SS type A sorting domain-containing protein [Chitinophagales bacterium]
MHTLSFAQEAVAPLYYHPPQKSEIHYNSSSRAANKTTAITLPFFEDFTSGGYYPDTNIWVDRKVYINNTMCVGAISRGVATFDAIDETGLPYETTNKNILRYADSLTSRPIDLSIYSPDDSLYFSFFYQPQGNGFDPQPQDSLMLYFRRASTTSPWTRVWRVAGSTLQPFQQVMIPVTDANLFHEGFQFRFVNKASINNTDDNWNVDYIRFGPNRNINDTLVNDVAFVEEPSFLLSDYTSMPYHQFMANANAERGSQHSTTIKNNTKGNVNINFGYSAKEFYTNTPLANGSNGTGIQADKEGIATFPVYTNTITAPLQNSAVLFQQKYYIESTSETGPVVNDTIIKNQLFHNFLAYDDGSPEKSYYLKLFTTLPGKLAIEHHLNVSDTLKGVAIYFGRQVPLPYQKYFSVVVYKDIAYGGGADQVLYQEDFFIPAYSQQNSFWLYKFEKPLVLPAGKFYIGTIQPALGTSDSLYFGLDLQRITNNHVYYNVLNQWKSSDIQGAVMIRPMFGEFFPSIISGPVNKETHEWDIIPNPVTDKIRFNYNKYYGQARYRITDLRGRTVKEGIVPSSEWVNTSDLYPGIYIVHFRADGYESTPRKIIKL